MICGGGKIALLRPPKPRSLGMVGGQNKSRKSMHRSPARGKNGHVNKGRITGVRAEEEGSVPVTPLEALAEQALSF